MRHQHVPNCLFHTLPDIDPVGPLLRELDSAVTGLQLTDPQRLYGDAALIDAALLSLTLIRQRIEALKAANAA